MSTVPDRLARWERFAPLTGLVAVVLWIVGVAIIEGGTDTPDSEASAEEIAAYFSDDSGAILAGAFIFMLGSAWFLWFLGTLRARVQWGEGGVGRIASIVFAAGIATAVMSIGFMAPQVAGAFTAEEADPGLEPAAAQALASLDDGFFVGGVATVAVFFLSAALAGLRTRAIPAWLAWASVVLGIAALFPWVGWAVFIWGLPLWVLIVSIWMYLRPAAQAPPTAP